MKRFVILLGCCFSLFLQGCSASNSLESTQFSSFTQTEAPLRTDDMSQTVTIECNDLYQITMVNGTYSYVLFNSNGDPVKTETGLTKEPHIKLCDSALVCVMKQAGTGIGTQSGFFYNPVNNVFSEIYQSIFDQKNGLVAHATKNTIIIESIFKDTPFYQEISVFQKPFAEVAEPFIDASFSEDCTSICVSYYSGMSYEKSTETFTWGQGDGSVVP